MDVFGADEAFMTGTGAGIVRIASLDGETIGTGEAPATTLKLVAAYERLRAAV
jgi:branched-chain amino acid aminotransferase